MGGYDAPACGCRRKRLQGLELYVAASLEEQVQSCGPFRPFVFPWDNHREKSQQE
jgi:hypothetical protein